MSDSRKGRKNSLETRKKISEAHCKRRHLTKPPSAENWKSTIEHSKMVQIRVTCQYNNELFYPVNETALKFAKLVNKKTLPYSDLQLIKSLGFEIEQTNAHDLGGI